MPHGAGLAMQAYPNKRIGVHRKWCTPMFVWSRGVLQNAPYFVPYYYFNFSSKKRVMVLKRW